MHKLDHIFTPRLFTFTFSGTVAGATLGATTEATLGDALAFVAEALGFGAALPWDEKGREKWKNQVHREGKSPYHPTICIKLG